MFLFVFFNSFGHKSSRFSWMLLPKPCSQVVLCFFESLKIRVSVSCLPLLRTNVCSEPLPLFGSVSPLCFFFSSQLFVKLNQGDEETTKINYLTFIGTPVQATNMSDFKRVRNKNGLEFYLASAKFLIWYFCFIVPQVVGKKGESHWARGQEGRKRRPKSCVRPQRPAVVLPVDSPSLRRLYSVKITVNKIQSLFKGRCLTSRVFMYKN